jgi:uncharacterized membrane protein YhaH (DUF805 family)
MEFVPAVRKALQNYAQFEGRAIRSEYWWFALFNVLVLVAATILDTLLGNATIFEILASLALLLPGLAVGARRLHDIDRSGWWLLVGLVPVLGGLLLIVWFATPGKPGPNRFGGDPLQVLPAAA